MLYNFKIKNPIEKKNQYNMHKTKRNKKKKKNLTSNIRYTV